jgi:hypothetical protein
MIDVHLEVEVLEGEGLLVAAVRREMDRVNANSPATEKGTAIEVQKASRFRNPIETHVPKGAVVTKRVVMEKTSPLAERITISDTAESAMRGMKKRQHTSLDL